MEYSNTTGLPSVTDILSQWIDKTWFKSYHSERGQACHDYMACYALGLPFLGKHWNPLWDPYVISGKQWFDDNVKDVHMVEERHQSNDYCGQPDLVCELYSGLIALIDWKTSVAEAKYWRFQTAAYKELIEINTDISIDIRMCIRLRKDYNKKALKNNYEQNEYDIGIFNCAKAVYLALK